MDGVYLASASGITAKFDKEFFAGDGVVVKKGKKSFIKVQA